MVIKVTTVDKSISEEFMTILAEDMKKDIDFRVLCELLVQSGWTKVELPYFDSRNHSIDIADWAFDNCGEHKQYATTYIFESAKDATAFALKWL